MRKEQHISRTHSLISKNLQSRKKGDVSTQTMSQTKDAQPTPKLLESRKSLVAVRMESRCFVSQEFVWRELHEGRVHEATSADNTEHSGLS